MEEPSSFRAELQLGYQAAWEFMFYHRPQDAGIQKRLRAGIQRLLISSEGERLTTLYRNRAEELTANGIRSARRLLFRMLHPDTVPVETDLLTALSSRGTVKRIKKVYSDILGGDDQLNAASLCVYSGPMEDSAAPDQWNISAPQCDPPLKSILGRLHPEDFYQSGQCSILYAGDADFRQTSDRDLLRGFLGMRRWLAIAVLQVPHHGSRYNWQQGSSAEFHHRWSVICADPGYRHKHPHQEVLLDLIHHGPRLVDKERQWEWWGDAVFP